MLLSALLPDRSLASFGLNSSRCITDNRRCELLHRIDAPVADDPNVGAALLSPINGQRQGVIAICDRGRDRLARWPTACTMYGINSPPTRCAEFSSADAGTTVHFVTRPIWDRPVLAGTSSIPQAFSQRVLFRSAELRNVWPLHEMDRERR